MPTTCTASNALTLSNAIRSIYLPQVATRVSQSSLPFRPKYQPFLTCSTPNTSLRYISPKRSLTTSTTLLNKERHSKNDESDSQHEDLILDLASAAVGHSKKKTGHSQKKSTDSKKSAEGGHVKMIKGIKNDQNLSKSKSATPEKKRKPEPWQVQKEALKRKFKEGWRPPKKLSPDTLDTIRHLHSTKPEEWTTPVLAEHFKVSPEAIRRILKSKWQPSEEVRRARQERWEKRYDRIYTHMAELGLRRPRKHMQSVSDVHRLGLDSRPSL